MDLSGLDLNSLRNDFRCLDRDGNGTISRREFIQVLGRNNNDQEEKKRFMSQMELRFQKADIDGDGEISFTGSFLNCLLF